MRRCVWLGLVLAIFVPHALAMGGCDNTPENPTLVLAALATGVYGVRQLRGAWKHARTVRRPPHS